MTYDYVHYNHIGAYRCTACGHAKPATDYTATAVDLDQGTLTLDGQVSVSLAFRSIYNVYNILAAYAACRECGVDGQTIGGVISNYILKNGRMQTFTLGCRRELCIRDRLHIWLVKSVEIDLMMFGRETDPTAYLWAALLTAGFSLLVNGLGFLKMRKIDMVESLKSAE